MSGVDPATVARSVSSTLIVQHDYVVLCVRRHSWRLPAYLLGTTPVGRVFAQTAHCLRLHVHLGGHVTDVSSSPFPLRLNLLTSVTFYSHLPFYGRMLIIRHLKNVEGCRSKPATSAYQRFACFRRCFNLDPSLFIWHSYSKNGTFIEALSCSFRGGCFSTFNPGANLNNAIFTRVTASSLPKVFARYRFNA